MGRYDQPANIRKILEVTGAPNLTYIGYSQGNQQMIYGLGTEWEFYKDKFRDVILISPCIYGEGTYEQLVDTYKGFYDIGIYAVGGDKWPESKRKICDKLSPETCTFWGYWPDNLEAGPFKSLQYTMQNYVEDEFREPVHIESYSRGQRDSEPIDLGVIDDSFPITFIIGDEDQTCTPELSERIFDEFTNADKHKWYAEGFNHETFGYVGTEDFVDRICETIEGEMHEMSMWDSIMSLFMMDGASSTLLASSAVALTTLALAF